MIEVRRCAAGEAEAVMRFIDLHWRPGHVLACSRELFDWQYGDPRRPGHNLMLAWRGDDLLGVLGYITDAAYDPALAPTATVWLALWKVRDDAGVAGLGLRLLRALAAEEHHAAMAVLGIGDERHPGMYRALGYETGECRHFVLFQHEASPRLAVVPPGGTRPTARAGSSVLEPLAGSDVHAAVAAIPVDPDHLPVKSSTYLQRRFVDHPFYEYRLHLVQRGGAPVGVLVSRVAAHDGARALRLVDVHGDPTELAGCGPAIDALIEGAGAEYADLWCAGVPAAALEAAGFAAVDPAGPLIVPNRFEPFAQANERLRYAMRAGGRPYMIFRANGDQDRPNQLPVHLGAGDRV